jgi:uncharacterized membrane protein YeaQ/YmgE (transglycosylase-associated protein family)
VGIIAWLVLGLIAGVVAKMAMPGKDPGGLIVTIAIGIAGAFIGGFLWNWYSGDEGYGDLSFGGVLIAIAGAMILLFVYRKVSPRFI